MEQSTSKLCDPGPREYKLCWDVTRAGWCFYDALPFKQQIATVSKSSDILLPFYSLQHQPGLGATNAILW